uniref:Si:ch73-380l3.2 n=1 Tax=Myripristis murdjan TaxID=586833 RepID=A0A667YWF6_9TELE
TSSLTSIDKQEKMMIFLLLLQAMSSPVFSAEWDAQVVMDLEALVTSCVVIPCTFTYPGGKIASSKLRGIWFLRNERNDTVFHEDKSEIAPNFRDRTKLMGRLGEGNCTLEMIEVKDHDRGPLCFQADIPGTGQFTFLKNCALLKMLYDPPKPTLAHQDTASQGEPYTITCSITHTCPSNMPTLTWSRSTGRIIEDHKNNGYGRWEMQSILTFIPEETDDHSKITCTAKFNGGGSSSADHTLLVQRKKNHRHIIVPTLVGIVIAVVFGAACILMMKKYNVWSRLSRMSRR